MMIFVISNLHKNQFSKFFKKLFCGIFLLGVLIPNLEFGMCVHETLENYMILMCDIKWSVTGER